MLRERMASEGRPYNSRVPVRENWRVTQDGRVKRPLQEELGLRRGALLGGEERGPVLEEGEGAVVFIGGGDEKKFVAVGRDVVVD